MFFREVCEIFMSTFFTEPLRRLLLYLRWLLLYFFKKVIKQLFRNLLWRTNNFFFSTYHLMYKKSYFFVYKFVINCHVFEITLSGCTLWSWKLTSLITWTILSETLFLDICWCAFNIIMLTDKACIISVKKKITFDSLWHMINIYEKE